MKIQIEIDTKSSTEVSEAIKLLTSLLNKAPEAKKTAKVANAIPKERKQAEKPENISEQPKKLVDDVKLGTLKDLARDKAQSVGRSEVKTAISKYADKLTEVAEKDYVSLAKDLEELK